MMGEWGQVITAMVTPLNDAGNVDEQRVAGLVEHLLTNGTDALVVCGTTGESPTLSREEKLKLYGLVREVSQGRAPVIAGTGSNDTAQSASLSEAAAKLGVDAVLCVAPYYNKPSQEGLYQHFRTVAEAAGVPVMLYNVPGRTSVNMEAGTALRLARDVKNIVAVKEASGNLLQASEIIAGAPAGFSLYSGEDALVLPLLSIGGCGVVSVTAHLVGRDMKSMCELFQSGRNAEAARLHAKMLPVVRACFQPTTPSPVPVKAALNMMGIPVGGLRLPLVELNDRERTIVRVALEEYGLLQTALPA